MEPTTPLSLDQFDFTLDPSRIAQAPVQPRDHSRLMHVATGAEGVAHHTFLDLPKLLEPGDLLVVNRTEVIPARLHLTRATGGKAELLLHTPVDGPLPLATTWQGLGRPGSALKPGAVVYTRNKTPLTIIARDKALCTVRAAGPMWPILEAEGKLPLPPYLARAHAPDADDDRNYQSMFAAERGAVAAPTASLHFTPRVMQALGDRGIDHAEVVLHVGPGTFLPIREEHEADVTKHTMHAEVYRVPEATQARIAATKARGGRVVAVGTTALRALETWAHTRNSAGASTLFVYPGYEPKVIDGLVTNFHLPKSTLLLLVCALAGRERMLSAYAEAQSAGYRFFSYGDAMLIL